MNFLAVFLGGGFGAIARYLLSLCLPKSVCCIPLCTLVANFFGCFIATVVFTYFVLKSNVNPIYKTFLITGFFGGLSTLSSLSLEVMEYFQNGVYAKGITYILISVVICVISVMLGLFVVKRYI